MASTISGDSAAPNATMTIVKIVQIMRQPGGDPGQVAEGDVARRDRRRVHRVEDLLQTRPPMIGNVASNEADCIAVAASSPGARNTRYGTPPSAALSET